MSFKFGVTRVHNKLFMDNNFTVINPYKEAPRPDLSQEERKENDGVFHKHQKRHVCLIL